MATSTMPPQVLGQRMQLTTLELGVGAALAAVAVLAVTLVAVTGESAQPSAGTDRDTSTSVVSQVPQRIPG
ncbi:MULTISPECIES: hypothetical protein [unclassified Dietzia]|uniref:hypothetical protein n=1 Tax=unclassified Dietzia TaxID=2617939 RepID=UPI000D22CD7C|nr:MULTISPECIES: hypothetical protein [unclassified Dietzia]AVZ40246.1 hypothetical protein CT688_12990 [Dietzia sp. JS16-p6b]MBB1025253.1 hypothetical protein [Dietzia sp. DQ12-76]MBB1027885.1 hypothetical protein [Dietzia sp. DQ11-38-2]QGW25712.1 hypothetical protein GJR88_04127 [Dietzia sp. DQ12-45-1b]